MKQQLLGLSVIYVPENSSPVVAIVNSINFNGSVNLTVLKPLSITYAQSIPFSQEIKSGHWSLMEAFSDEKV